MSYKNYKFFSLKFYLFPIFLLIFQTHTFATENHNFTLFDIKLGSNISTIPNLKFIDECKKKIYSRNICENKIVYQASFSPKKKYDSIDEYLVNFSPISKKIYHISGNTKKFRTYNECSDFNRNVKTVVGERLVNENQKIIVQKADSYSWFKLNQRFSGGRDLLTINLELGCWPDNPKKPLEANYGYLSLGFSDDYKNNFVEPEFQNIVNQKQNQKDKKNTEKLRNF
jgi:hypothetical protein